MNSSESSSDEEAPANPRYLLYSWSKPGTKETPTDQLRLITREGIAAHCSQSLETMTAAEARENIPKYGKLDNQMLSIVCCLWTYSQIKAKGWWKDDFDSGGNVKPQRVPVGLPPLILTPDDEYHYHLIRRYYMNTGNSQNTGKGGRKDREASNKASNEPLNTWGTGTLVPDSTLQVVNPAATFVFDCRQNWDVSCPQNMGIFHETGAGSMVKLRLVYQVFNLFKEEQDEQVNVPLKKKETKARSPRTLTTPTTPRTPKVPTTPKRKSTKPPSTGSKPSSSGGARKRPRAAVDGESPEKTPAHKSSRKQDQKTASSIPTKPSFQVNTSSSEETGVWKDWGKKADIRRPSNATDSTDVGSIHHDDPLPVTFPPQKTPTAGDSTPRPTISTLVTVPVTPPTDRFQTAPAGTVFTSSADYIQSWKAISQLLKPQIWGNEQQMAQESFQGGREAREKMDTMSGTLNTLVQQSEDMQQRLLGINHILRSKPLSKVSKTLDTHITQLSTFKTEMEELKGGIDSLQHQLSRQQPNLVTLRQLEMAIPLFPPEQSAILRQQAVEMVADLSMFGYMGLSTQKETLIERLKAIDIDTPMTDPQEPTPRPTRTDSQELAYPPTLIEETEDSLMEDGRKHRNSEVNDEQEDENSEGNDEQENGDSAVETDASAMDLDSEEDVHLQAALANSYQDQQAAGVAPAAKAEVRRLSEDLHNVLFPDTTKESAGKNSKAQPPTGKGTGSALGAPFPATSLEVKPGDWRCTVRQCQYPNPHSAFSCLRCQSPRPQGKSGKETTTARVPQKSSKISIEVPRLIRKKESHDLRRDYTTSASGSDPEDFLGKLDAMETTSTSTNFPGQGRREGVIRNLEDRTHIPGPECHPEYQEMLADLAREQTDEGTEEEDQPFIGPIDIRPALVEGTPALREKKSRSKKAGFLERVAAALKGNTKKVSFAGDDEVIT